ncbi:sensor histidine kinase [Nocardiopsis sp. RSe5-2]|uniref:histidine kinase n=1 Tax=Nocardiopsis endophytica TaxID=3018445 RepID=A0ABT4UB67_9ACTN|nr:sensor histidine kinase [Nocardiopsis endophytica]MDA2814217.1 sensor histidine kinase [Nocardiopsis endophytica]
MSTATDSAHPKGGGGRDVARWVSLSGTRAPLLLHAAFWGAYAGTIVTTAVLFTVPLPEQGLANEVLNAAFLAALVPTALLWPFLSWTPGAPGRRPQVLSLLFFLCTAVLMAGSGGLLVQIMVFAAIGNVVTVLGPRAALACTALLSTAAVGVHVLPPAQIATGLFEGSVVVFFGLLSVMAFTALIAAQQRTRETRQVLAELEEAHSELRRYADRVRELTIAEERARMAREMHDSVGHYLTVLNIGLSNAERFRTAKPEAAWQEVADAKRLAQEALADTRRWVRALRPLQLEGKAGPEAVRALAEAFSGGGGEAGSNGARVRSTCVGDWPDLGEEAELVCYRVVQEGLTNAVRHSGARTIDVALECGPEGVAASVVDDGHGAADGVPAGAGGFGIAGLRERVEAVGGTLEAGPRGGGGFALRAVLPSRPRPAEPAGVGAEAPA